MSHAPAIDQDLDRGFKAGNLETGGFDRRLRFGHADGNQQGDRGADERELEPWMSRDDTNAVDEWSRRLPCLPRMLHLSGRFGGAAILD